MEPEPKLLRLRVRKYLLKTPPCRPRLSPLIGVLLIKRLVEECKEVAFEHFEVS